MDQVAAEEQRETRALRRNVMVLGWVSFFSDVSSEMIYPLLPLFLANVLGAPVSAIGLIEGIAESTASLLKVVSGWLSDRLGRRKALATLGYVLSNLTKPLFAVTTAWPQVLAIRFTDRVGKGVRTSPRDVILADSVPAGERGGAFGLQRAMDTAGAVAGPLTAFAVLSGWPGDYRRVFLLALLPGIAAILLIALGVRDPAAAGKSAAALPRPSLAPFDRRFKLFLLAVTVFMLGNSSDAFLLLRAQNLGVPAEFVPILWGMFNIVYATTAWPAGRLSDRIGRKTLVVAGYLVFALVYAGFALASTAWHAWLLFAAYGIYYGTTDGVQRAFAADLAPPHLRGTAFGVFHTLTGLALFPASVIAGLLWQSLGVPAPFIYGAGMALVAVLVFIRQT